MAENRNQENRNRGYSAMDDQKETGRGEQAQEQPRRTSNRGFAAMDPERQRQIAREGGRAAHMQGVAHQWTSEEARAAGRKGGQNSRGGGRKNESEA